MTVCSRTGCTKTLRSDNSVGKCSSNCESPEAPPSHRAKGVSAASAPKRESVPEKASSSSSEVIERFRAVAEAVGRDPDEMIAEFAQSWLDGIRGIIEG